MSKVFFDTNVFIYMFEGLDPFRSRALEIRKRTIDSGDQIVTSAMTLGEILVRPTKLGQTSLIEEYDRAIRTTARIISFDPSIAWRYASLRATHATNCSRSDGAARYPTDELTGSLWFTRP